MSIYQFGKHPVKNDYRTLRFKDYVLSALAPAPAAYSALERVYAKLNINHPATLFPLDGNGQYGDCTIAALAHAITMFNGLLGKKEIMTEAATVKIYLQLTKGLDSGLPELDVLNFWQSKKTIEGGPILAFTSIDPKNHEHVKKAIQLFGGVYLGFQVQRNCQKEFTDRTPWIPGTLTPHGHAVFAVEYDEAGVTVLTWGDTQKATWGWWNECVDESYAILPSQATQPGYSPGFNVTQLIQDLKEVAD
jgi:hypothetical protein